MTNPAIKVELRNSLGFLERKTMWGFSEIPTWMLKAGWRLSKK